LRTLLKEREKEREKGKAGEGEIIKTNATLHVFYVTLIYTDPTCPYFTTFALGSLSFSLYFALVLCQFVLIDDDVYTTK
jgi:hypothetical protein